MNINNFKALISQGRLVDATELSSEDLLIVGRYIQGTRNVDQYPDFVISAKQLADTFSKKLGLYLVNSASGSVITPSSFYLYGNETTFTCGDVLKFPDFSDFSNLLTINCILPTLQEWPDLSKTNIKDFTVSQMLDVLPYNAITTFDGLVFSNLIENISIFDSITLDDYLEVNSPTFSNLITLDLHNNNFSQANVDAQLQSVYNLVTGPYNTNSFTTLDLSGGANAAPSAAGVIIKNALLALGIGVATN